MHRKASWVTVYLTHGSIGVHLGSYPRGAVGKLNLCKIGLTRSRFRHLPILWKRRVLLVGLLGQPEGLTVLLAIPVSMQLDDEMSGALCVGAVVLVDSV